jgi:hypothetical protein
MSIAGYLLAAFLSFVVLPFLYSLNWDHYATSKRIKEKRGERIVELGNKIINELENQKRNSIKWVTLRHLKKNTSDLSETDEWNEARRYLEDNDQRYHFGSLKMDNYDQKVVYLLPGVRGMETN